MKPLLSRLDMPPFSPLPPLWGGRRQTIAAFLWPQKFPDSEETLHRLTLSDQDQLVLVEDAPTGAPISGETDAGKTRPRDTEEISVLVHGLTGCYQSSYLQRISRKLRSQGHRVFRVNLRGCGPGFGLAKLPYHSGRSEDIRQVIEWIHQRHPQARINLIGFSLGANISLKLAGEGPTPAGLQRVIAVSPPINLKACTAKMAVGANQLFSRFFTTRLIEDVRRIEAQLPAAQRTQFPTNLSLRDFDEIYTAPKSGFKSADDYYSRCSSGQFIPIIELPTLILFAEDDPVIAGEDFSKIPPKENIDLVITTQGGHVAFLGFTGQTLNYYWMDELIGRWLA